MSETKHVEFAPVVDAKWLEDPANWRRMKAAMYATSGIPTEALERGDLARVLLDAQSFASAVSAASEVDRSEWTLHRGMAGVVRDRIHRLRTGEEP